MRREHPVALWRQPEPPKSARERYTYRTRIAERLKTKPVNEPDNDHSTDATPAPGEPNIARVSYGDGVPDDVELGLLGDVTGRRVIELGISDNAVALARLGAKAIVLDPDEDAIGRLRTDAADADVPVECHIGDLADLGFAPSGTIDMAVSVHTLDMVDDLGRILRQVHRVLKAGAPFVIVLDHPFAFVGLSDDGSLHRYGDDRRTIGDLLAALDRSNFRVETLHELGITTDTGSPTKLVAKVRKLGS